MAQNPSNNFQRFSKSKSRLNTSGLLSVGVTLWIEGCATVQVPRSEMQQQVNTSAEKFLDPFDAYRRVVRNVPLERNAHLISLPKGEKTFAFEGFKKEIIFNKTNLFLSESEVSRYLLNAGFNFDHISQMVCTAHLESRLDPSAIGINKDKLGNEISRDLGLWQINDANWKLCGISKQDELFNPTINTRCAKKVFDAQGFRAWVAYRKNEKKCKNYALLP